MPTIEEPIPKRTDEKKFVRNWAFLRMAHEALGLNNMKRAAQWVDAQATFAASGNKEDLKVPEQSDDDMANIIGNEIHNHYQGAPETTTATTTTQASSGTGTLGKMLLGAALVAGGAGAGVVAGEILKPDAPAVVDTDTDTDSDTSIDVSFPE